MISVQIEDAADDEAQVHEVVPEAVVQRSLVEPRHVPGDEDDDPDRHSYARAQQEPKRPAEPRRPGERDEQVAREEEDGERPRTATDGERDTEVGDEDVLEHVDALEVPLADRVDRRDDREHGTITPATKSGNPRPGREVGAAPMETRPAVEEECDRDEAAADHDRLDDQARHRFSLARRAPPSTRFRLAPAVSRRREWRAPPPGRSGSRPPCACARCPRDRCTPSGSGRPGG